MTFDRLSEEARRRARTSGKTKEAEFVRLLDDPANRVRLGMERHGERLLIPRVGSKLEGETLATCRAIASTWPAPRCVWPAPG